MIYYSIEFVFCRCAVWAEKRVVALFVAVGVLFCTNNYIIHEPGYLHKNGQETYHVPDGTDCVFVIPSGSYNESAEETSILAQCDRVGVVYANNIDILAEEYNYEPGDYLLVEIIKHLDIDETVSTVKEKLDVTELREISRSQGANVIRILLGQ